MGHLVEMARNSRVAVELDLACLPVLAAAADGLEQGIFPGAVERNQEYTLAWTRVADPRSEPYPPILFDPQTSGGLLISLPKTPALELVAELHARGHVATAIIGPMMKVSERQKAGEVTILNHELKRREGSPMPPVEPSQTASPPVALSPPASSIHEPAETAACCSNLVETSAGNHRA